MNASKNSREAKYSGLRGKTMRIYWHFLTHKEPCTVRGLQRALDFSSPSLVLHHLEKLKQMQLIQETPDGTYRLIKEVKVGLLRFFTGSGRFLVPRHLFYVCFYAAILVASVLIFPTSPSSAFILLLAVLIFGIITSIFEALYLWRTRQFYM